MQPARGNKKKGPNHDDEYWQRLKEQFEACHYCHSGAYSNRNNGRSREINEMVADIDYTEQILKGEKMGELLKHGYFEPRPSDRLLKAGNFFKGRIS